MHHLFLHYILQTDIFNKMLKRIPGKYSHLNLNLHIILFSLTVIKVTNDHLIITTRLLYTLHKYADMLLLSVDYIYYLISS